VRRLTVELQRVPRLEHVDRAAVTVGHDTGQHVEELGARVLVEREDLGVLGERHQLRCHPAVLAAHGTELLVVVAGRDALAADLRAVPGLDEDRVPFLVEAAEERGERCVQGLGQPCQGGKAWRDLGVLDLG